MTSTCSAAATALPTDRRALLSGAALASLVAASAAAPTAFAAAADPAGPIERAYLEWLPYAKAHDAACELTWEREEHYEEPEAPRWHPFTSEGGHKFKITDRDAREGICQIDDSEDNIAKLRQIVEAPGTVFTADAGWEPDMLPPRVASAQRTLNAVLAWKAECARRADAAGLTGAIEHERACAKEDAVRRRAIFAMTPTTFREAAFQAAILEFDWDELAACRLHTSLRKLAGITSHIHDEDEES